MPKIKIDTKGVLARISIDGEKIKGVTGYEIIHNANAIPLLKLSLSVTDLEIEGDFILESPETINVD